jgi:hypothetical protein
VAPQQVQVARVARQKARVVRAAAQRVRVARVAQRVKRQRVQPRVQVVLAVEEQVVQRRVRVARQRRQVRRLAQQAQPHRSHRSQRASHPRRRLHQLVQQFLAMCQTQAPEFQCPPCQSRSLPAAHQPKSHHQRT